MLKAHIFKQQQQKINRHTLQKHTASLHSSPVAGSVALWNLSLLSLLQDRSTVSSSTFPLAEQKVVSCPRHRHSTSAAQLMREEEGLHQQPLKLHSHYIKNVSQRGAVWQYPRMASLPHNGKVKELRLQIAYWHFNSPQLLPSRHDAILTIQSLVSKLSQVVVTYQEKEKILSNYST